MTEFERMIWLDRAFVMMETRGLVLLLKGESRKLYQEFLKKPQDYRTYIRELVMKHELN
jgi:hypothetical protein